MSGLLSWIAGGKKTPSAAATATAASADASPILLPPSGKLSLASLLQGHVPSTNYPLKVVLHPMTYDDWCATQSLEKQVESKKRMANLLSEEEYAAIKKALEEDKKEVMIGEYIIELQIMYGGGREEERKYYVGGGKIRIRSYGLNANDELVKKGEEDGSLSTPLVTFDGDLLYPVLDYALQEYNNSKQDWNKENNTAGVEAFRKFTREKIALFNFKILGLPFWEENTSDIDSNDPPSTPANKVLFAASKETRVEDGKTSSDAEELTPPPKGATPAEELEYYKDKAVKNKSLLHSSQKDVSYMARSQADMARSHAHIARSQADIASAVKISAAAQEKTAVSLETLVQTNQELVRESREDRARSCNALPTNSTDAVPAITPAKMPVTPQAPTYLKEGTPARYKGAVVNVNSLTAKMAEIELPDNKTKRVLQTSLVPYEEEPEA